MPRQAKTTIENNFTKGLITENTALNFPENACTDTLNCVFSETGRVTRRFNIDLEKNYVFDTDNHSYTSNEKGFACTEYLWHAPRGDGKETFLVQQIGSYIYFYGISYYNYTSFTSTQVEISPQKLVTEINLVTYEAQGARYDSNIDTIFQSEYEYCQYSTVGKYLVIVNGACNPIVCTYNGTTVNVNEDYAVLRFRDFEGVPYTTPTSYGPGDRPVRNFTGMLASGTNDERIHLYNILNQGWWQGGNDPSTSSVSINGTSRACWVPLSTSALGQWDTARTDMPANGDQVAFTRASETDSFDNNRVDTAVNGGSAIAAKGHFIIRLDYRDTTAVGGPRGVAMANKADNGSQYGNVISNLMGTAVGVGPSLDPYYTVAYTRPTVTAAFAGRVIYAGFRDPIFGSSIFFTKIIEEASDLGKCHQINDPTSEDYFDLLDSDGGQIIIPEIGQICKIWTFQTSLIVFASNGIWLVRGTDGGFSPNSYYVRQLNTIGTDAPLSFVDYNGLPIWWSEEGISQMKYNPQFDTFTVDSLTNTTIKELYQSIPGSCRSGVKGCYDYVNEIAYWVYIDDEDEIDTIINFNPPVSIYQVGSYYRKCLVYNTKSQAFYPWEFVQDDNSPKVRGIIFSDSSFTKTKPSVKFPISRLNVSGNNKNTFAEMQFEDSTYIDWNIFATDLTLADASGSYDSYFISGYRVHGDSMRFVQPNYVMFHLEQEEDSSCYVQGIFDYASNGNAGRYGSTQQIYNDTTISRYINTRRLKIRGKGRSVQFKLTSEAGKPFTIIGWAVMETQNAAV